jgi:hypothetical protein
MTFASGTVATPGTIPAQDKAVGGTSGTGAAGFTSGKAALDISRENLRRVVWHANECLAALGFDTVPSSVTGPGAPTVALADVPTVVAAAAAPNSMAVSKADADAFLLATANGMATLAAKWNTALADVDDGFPLMVTAG